LVGNPERGIPGGIIRRRDFGNSFSVLKIHCARLWTAFVWFRREEASVGGEGEALVYTVMNLRFP
jgi:hypothetical protein